jgi:RHS repeat-associated protein
VPSGGTISYTWGRTDGNDLPVLASLTSANGTSYLTHDDNGNPLAIKSYSGGVAYYVLDGLGSPVALVNSSGTLIATYTYDPYGTATVNNLTNSTATAVSPYRFAGGLNDRTTGYVQYGLRYYDPGTGRFTQQDSLEVLADPSRGNRYQYAGSNPVNYVDPSGRDFATDLGGFIGGALGALAASALCGPGAPICLVFFGTLAGGTLGMTGAYVGRSISGLSEEEIREEMLSSLVFGGLGSFV